MWNHSAFAHSQPEIAALEKANADKDHQAKQSDEIISELREELRKATLLSGSESPRFERNKKVYALHAKKVRINKQDYSAEDILNSTQLQDILINMGSGVIAEITE